MIHVHVLLLLLASLSVHPSELPYGPPAHELDRFGYNRDASHRYGSHEPPRSTAERGYHQSHPPDPWKRIADPAGYQPDITPYHDRYQPIEYSPHPQGYNKRPHRPTYPKPYEPPPYFGPPAHQVIDLRDLPASCPTGSIAMSDDRGESMRCLPGRDICPGEGSSSCCLHNGVDYFCCKREKDRACPMLADGAKISVSTYNLHHSYDGSSFVKTKMPIEEAVFVQKEELSDEGTAEVVEATEVDEATEEKEEADEGIDSATEAPADETTDGTEATAEFDETETTALFTEATEAPKNIRRKPTNKNTKSKNIRRKPAKVDTSMKNKKVKAKKSKKRKPMKSNEETVILKAKKAPSRSVRLDTLKSHPRKRLRVHPSGEVEELSGERFGQVRKVGRKSRERDSYFDKSTKQMLMELWTNQRALAWKDGGFV